MSFSISWSSHEESRFSSNISSHNNAHFGVLYECAQYCMLFSTCLVQHNKFCLTFNVLSHHALLNSLDPMHAFETCQSHHNFRLVLLVDFVWLYLLIHSSSVLPTIFNPWIKRLFNLTRIKQNIKVHLDVIQLVTFKCYQALSSSQLP